MLDGKIDLSEVITMFSVEQNSCPLGYYNIRRRGKLIYNWNEEKYNFFEEMGNAYVHTYSLPVPETVTEPSDKINIQTGELTNYARRHGPAIMDNFPIVSLDTRPSVASSITCDRVICIRCLAWPPDAHSWSKRKRAFEWPSNVILTKVINEGCDFVNVAHRNFRQDRLQWRISFSRAEVILIRSWTPTQQIIYHMLRYFFKQEMIKHEDLKDDNILSGYHIKTLMLWACEQHALHWWDSKCVIDICSELLQYIASGFRKQTI